MSVKRCVREEENSSGFHVANSEETIIRGAVAAETINTEDIVTSGEFKKQKAQNLKKTDVKRKYMTSSSGKCQRKLIRITLGNGYPKMIWRLEQKHYYVMHRNRPSGQIM